MDVDLFFPYHNQSNSWLNMTYNRRIVMDEEIMHIIMFIIQMMTHVVSDPGIFCLFVVFHKECL